MSNRQLARNDISSRLVRWAHNIKRYEEKGYFNPDDIQMATEAVFKLTALARQIAPSLHRGNTFDVHEEGTGRSGL